MLPPRRESPSEERLEPKREVKETRKERDEEVPEVQEKGEQEEGRERSRRAAAVKATQTLQANESVSVTSTWGARARRSWTQGCGMEGRAGIRTMIMIIIIILAGNVLSTLCS